MRIFSVSDSLLALALSSFALALAWFAFSMPLDEEDVSPPANTRQMKADRASVVDLSPSQKERSNFQQEAGNRLKAMNLSLDQLKAKAENGRAVTKEQMNAAITDLDKKTQAAREELRQLEAALPERLDVLKARLNTSLQELEDHFEKAFSRFMNEWA